jgi:hypothetical protein
MYQLICDKCRQKIKMGQKYRFFSLSVAKLQMNMHPGYDEHKGEKNSDFIIGECCLPQEMLKDELLTDFEAREYFIKGLNI